MFKVAKRFAAAVGFLSAIVGLYIAADVANFEWAFWVVIAGSALFAIGPRLSRSLINALLAIRNYPRLLERVSDLEELLKQEQEGSDELSAQIQGTYDSGIKEGMARVIGGMLAMGADVTPGQLCLTDDEGEIVLRGIVPKGSSFATGTRFSLIFSQTGDVKGVVSVLFSDADTGSVHMSVVEKTVPRFWDYITERIEIDQALPVGHELVPYDPFRSTPAFSSSSPTTQEEDQ